MWIDIYCDDTGNVIKNKIKYLDEELIEIQGHIVWEGGLLKIGDIIYELEFDNHDYIKDGESKIEVRSYNLNPLPTPVDITTYILGGN